MTGKIERAEARTAAFLAAEQAADAARRALDEAWTAECKAQGRWAGTYAAEAAVEAAQTNQRVLPDWARKALETAERTCWDNYTAAQSATRAAQAAHTEALHELREATR